MSTRRRITRVVVQPHPKAPPVTAASTWHAQRRYEPSRSATASSQGHAARTKVTVNVGEADDDLAKNVGRDPQVDNFALSLDADASLGLATDLREPDSGSAASAEPHDREQMLRRVGSRLIFQRFIAQQSIDRCCPVDDRLATSGPCRSASTHCCLLIVPSITTVPRGRLADSRRAGSLGSS